MGLSTTHRGGKDRWLQINTPGLTVLIGRDIFQPLLTTFDGDVKLSNGGVTGQGDPMHAPTKAVIVIDRIMEDSPTQIPRVSEPKHLQHSQRHLLSQKAMLPASHTNLHVYLKWRISKKHHISTHLRLCNTHSGLTWC
jgi:hypothetical protein